MNEQYKVIFDNGKPYEVICKSYEELKTEILRFYEDNKNYDYAFDFVVLNNKDEDITETQFIQEITSEIINDELEQEGLNYEYRK